MILLHFIWLKSMFKNDNYPIPDPTIEVPMRICRADNDMEHLLRNFVVFVSMFCVVVVSVVVFDISSIRCFIASALHTSRLAWKDYWIFDPLGVIHLFRIQRS